MESKTRSADSLSPKETLELMLGHLGFAFEIEEENREGTEVLHIRTRSPSRLIGKEGRTIDDLQFLLNRMISRADDTHTRVMLDVENYRSHQKDELLAKISALVDEVRATGKSIELPPLNSFERRIVHQHFKGDPEIETISPETKTPLKRILVQKRNQP